MAEFNMTIHIHWKSHKTTFTILIVARELKNSDGKSPLSYSFPGLPLTRVPLSLKRNLNTFLGISRVTAHLANDQLLNYSE